MVPGELDLGFDPELRFAISRMNVDVEPFLLSREEKEPERTITEHGRTHAGDDASCPGGEDRCERWNDWRRPAYTAALARLQ